MNNKIAFLDIEVEKNDKIADLGAIKDEQFIHTKSIDDFVYFVSDCDFLCGHNIISHDLKYLSYRLNSKEYKILDTLYLSPLLFPERPYHALLKDDILQNDQLNNPVNDSQKAKELFFDEVNAFKLLNIRRQRIYKTLLKDTEQFRDFFSYIECDNSINLIKDIQEEFKNKICQNADLELIIKKCPIELCYALALISVDDKYSIIPPWVQIQFPYIDNVMKLLRNTPCNICEYCNENFNLTKRLKDIFGYNEFRKYNDESLQENAVKAAVNGKSLLAIFPTGGGKSLTFQLPALLAGESSHALTIVISPLQSLMKDQVDSLAKKGIVDAVTINGLLTPLERADAIERVKNGLASILYISPESLRSVTIENLLLSRNVARFVIDEAHCFSAWGQDFRVDYTYIGDFIRELKEKKKINYDIPVSCFTATAKPKVISDICDYFRQKLGIELELYTTTATRKNLKYKVLFKETEDEKYQMLRNLIESNDCSTIVYVSRIHRTKELAEKLTRDGFPALPYNGKMETIEKITNQNAFMNNEVKIIVATSAFGMGVDKQDVKLVIHYDISDSLENYIQEAGRAGRDQTIQADCYVLFNDEDLNKHFILLNQTKLTFSEIQQVWKAIKNLTKTRYRIYKSALEIAREAGWDDTKQEIETRVKTAITALEKAGYIKRGKNYPRVYASSILVANRMQAIEIIKRSDKLTDKEKEIANRVIGSLISKRSRSKNQNEDAESRVDYLSDRLGIDKKDIINVINIMREENILADSMDLKVNFINSDNKNKIDNTLNNYIRIERFLIKNLNSSKLDFNFKELNNKAIKEGLNCSVAKIRNVLLYWTVREFIQKQINVSERYEIEVLVSPKEIESDLETRIELSKFIINYLQLKSATSIKEKIDENSIDFSTLELKNKYSNKVSLFKKTNCSTQDIQDALLYLNKINALNLEGGFLVIYNPMEIERIEKDNKIKYKREDYKELDDFYKQKIQQIHIIGEYAKIMVEDYDKALEFVHDYFNLEYKHFLLKYFKGNRMGEINRNITTQKYKQLFGDLSDKQSEIINDDSSQYIVVAAGPGSGKTKVLVHKLASLLLMEDIKHEQLLMLTFSRSAAIEFKSRLIKLIGNAANFIEIKTFHSYCFDILGQIGNIEDSSDIVKKAVEMIMNDEVEMNRITKSVLVIDEAQDMDKNEFGLINALIQKNNDMRIIAVGDDDQNIYEFRGSNSSYLKSLITDFNATKYELLDNYRSSRKIIEFANEYVKKIKNRMKINSIKPVSNDEGRVKLTKHLSHNIELPVTDDLIYNNYSGSTCILTGTNEEALKVLGCLNQKGIKCKLIQTNDGFNLYNLAEIRYFMYIINYYTETPVIDTKIWDLCIKKLEDRYKGSECLENCLLILNKFNSVNRTKYKTDLEEYIFETNYDDYLTIDRDTIIVSTIHKAKGKEFDNVYILLDNYRYNGDESRRSIYVGITRAKRNLVIHYFGNEFDNYAKIVNNYFIDKKMYDMPNEIILQLGHKDVYLNFFKDKKTIIKDMKSGNPLYINGEYLYTIINNNNIDIIKFSQARMDIINNLKELGYQIVDAKVRFIVDWKGENDNQDYMIVLPDIKFIKQQ